MNNPNNLNRLIIFITLGFVSIVSLGAYKTGTKDTGWDAITGVPTNNSYISTTPGLSKIPMTGTTSSSLSDWISGTLTVQSVIATATASIGTPTAINNSILTIYGSATAPLNISMGSGIIGAISAIMTSNTAPSPNVTSASTIFGDGYEAWRAFNRTTASGWISDSVTPTGWLKYDFGVGNEKVLERYDIRILSSEGAATAPVSFTLEGSNNDSTWTVLDKQIKVLTGWGASITKSFYIASYNTAYRYYKLDITESGAGGSNYVSVEELTFFSAGFQTVVQITNTGIVSVGTTTPKSTDTAFVFQIEGNGLANQWGVACFGAIKFIIGSGSEVVKQGYDAVMGTKLFMHHPKKVVSKEEAEGMAVNDYVNNFIKIDFETFKSDNLSKYTSIDSAGSSTVNWEMLVKDFQTTYVLPRVDEFYLIANTEQRILNKRKELEVDKSITNITPISDNASTSPLFRLNNSDFLSIENQIGGLMATAQYQRAEIGSLTAALENLRILNNLK